MRASKLPDEASTAAKSALRDAMKGRRAAIPDDRRTVLSAAAALQVAHFLHRHPLAIVSAFLSIGEELDTGPILETVVGSGNRLCLPVMQGRGKPLLFRAYTLGDPLRTVQWGIREPLETAAGLEPDVLLLPLLAFDRAGNRLGYGGGYYDRTLKELRARRSVIAVGLTFDEQEVDAVPHLDYDEPLDWIVTPSRLLSASA